MKKIIVSVIAFGLLIVSTVFAFTPFASRYITAYDTFLVDKGSGKIEIQASMLKNIEACL